MTIKILGGRGFKKQLFGKITRDTTHVTVRIVGMCNVEENELFYPVKEFDEKGVKKVLRENGYKLAQ